MLFIIVGLIMIILSAVANAIADTLENRVAFEASIFYKLNRRFWLKEVSWQYARKLFAGTWFEYKIDAWHLAESFQVLLFAGALILPFPIKHPYISGWWIVVLYCSLGAVYIVTFNYTYKLLKRKPDATN